MRKVLSSTPPLRYYSYQSEYRGTHPHSSMESSRATRLHSLGQVVISLTRIRPLRTLHCLLSPSHLTPSMWSLSRLRLEEAAAWLTRLHSLQRQVSMPKATSGWAWLKYTYGIFRRPSLDWVQWWKMRSFKWFKFFFVCNRKCHVTSLNCHVI